MSGGEQGARDEEVLTDEQVRPDGDGALAPVAAEPVRSDAESRGLLSTLGRQASEEIDQLREEILLKQGTQSSDQLERIGQWNAATYQAEEMVLRESILAEPEPEVLQAMEDEEDDPEYYEPVETTMDLVVEFHQMTDEYDLDLSVREGDLVDRLPTFKHFQRQSSKNSSSLV